MTIQPPLASCTILGDHNMEVNNRKKHIMDSRPICASPLTDHQSEKLIDPCKDQSTLLTGKTVVPSSPNAQDKMTRYIIIESSDTVANISWNRRESEDDAFMMPLEEVIFSSPTTPPLMQLASPSCPHTCMISDLGLRTPQVLVIHCPVVSSSLGLKQT